jgi:predicted MFS family arabinose efflux permease
MTVRAARLRAAAVVAVLLAVAMASQFTRNSHAVVAPDIASELGLPIQSLGVMSGALFLAAAITMIPFGSLFDAWGARPVLAGKLAVAAAGALAFGAAHSLDGLVAGRVLLGVGSAALVMGALVIASRWAPPQAFGTVVGLTLALSHVGNLASTAPLAWLVGWVGWRSAFTLIAAALATLSVVVWMLARDAPPGHPYHAQSRPNAWASMRGVVDVLRLPGFLHVAALSFVAFAAFVTVLGVWASPYLRDRFGLDAVGRSHVLLAMTAGIIVGNSIYGLADRRVHSRKRLVTIGAVGNAAVLAALALRAQHASLAEVVVLLTLLGASSCYTATLIAHGRSLYPDALIGRGMSTLNAAVLAGAAFTQIASAQVARPFGTAAGGLEPIGYSVMFAVLSGWVLLGLAVYRGGPDSHARSAPVAAAPAAGEAPGR